MSRSRNAARGDSGAPAAGRRSIHELSTFKDHFSVQAGSYAAFRPLYPPELFAYLASLAPRRERAWDPATGNGQAARGLAVEFRQVMASDASIRQVMAREPAERVRFWVARAEAGALPARSVDLILVAQALHWLDHEAFWAEVRRVARDGAVVAASYYTLCRIAPAIDRWIDGDFRERIDAYWPPERRLLDAGYRTIPFPFPELEAPGFELIAEWTRAELLGYLGTWSATMRYRRAVGEDPRPELEARLSPLWPEGERRHVRWPLGLRVGVVRS